ncbi:MAG: hypothetical protein GXO50_05605 [Chlorobi bacterium]|nr:hypothetical protein [Chlorobiota bacterium]
MQKIKILIFSAFIILSITLTSCKNDNNFDIDVSDIKIKINVKHFEKDLFKFKLDSADFYINLYKKKYGEFFKLFNYQITEIGPCDNKNYPENLDMFVRYWKTENIPHILDSAFADFDTEQIPQIENAFKHYKYYFPEDTIPDIYTFFSSFGYSVVTLDGIVGLGLDKYLGKKFYYLYDRVGWSKYQKRRMIKPMITTDIMRAVAVADYPYNDENGDNMLKKIIYEGKIQYFLNCMLPDVPDTLKWRYTARQLAWAEKYENKIWSYIAAQKLLYSVDRTEIRKFTGDGPYTSAFTDVSAPRAGSFIGYKIVEKYMKNNPDVSLKDLMEEQDERKILAGAKYNP